MTLAVAIPVICAFAALVELVLFMQWRTSGKISERLFPVLAMTTLAMPIIAYALLKYAFPEAGAVRLF